MIQLEVIEDPKGQPRPRRSKSGGVYTPDTADAFKAAIRREAAKHIAAGPIEDAVKISFEFVFARPKSHYRTGRFADQLKPKAPLHHTIKPDGDNVVKAAQDALVKAGLLADDSIVVKSYCAKSYGHRGAAQITIERI